MEHDNRENPKKCILFICPYKSFVFDKNQWYPFSHGIEKA